MAEIRKMGLANALVLFRGELNGVKVSQNKRLQLMEQFKEAFDRSEDYDLALEATLSKLVPGLSFVDETDEDEEKSFKAMWQKMNPPSRLGELDENEMSKIQDEVKNKVLNEGFTMKEAADEVSKDYDLVYDEVLSLTKNIQKTVHIRKGFVDWFFGRSGNAVDRLKQVIDLDFKQGLSEVDVINSLILDASEHFDRPLSQKETDIIRMHVINEKVKMKELGLI